MPTLLFDNIHTLVTMDDERRELTDAAILVQDNVIEAVGSRAALKEKIERTNRHVDETINLRDHLVLPGLINTHHHMSQSLTRAFPGGQDHDLYGWLTALLSVWHRLTPPMIYASARTAMAELILSGCTTSTDHLYLYPNGCAVDDEVRAAKEIGMRFCACRGSVTLNGMKDVLPDRAIETEDAVTRDTMRLIDEYHDSSRYGMLRISVAPGSLFSVPKDYFRESVNLARSYKDPTIRMHTHLAETADEYDMALATFGQTPMEFCEDVGWIGEDIWNAHCVHLSDAAIARFAETGMGVTHCPNSNMRTAAGIAPIRKMLDAGVRVSLGVDGSASNDAGHMLGEARQAVLLQRAQGNPKGMTVREGLAIATRGGAAVLGRDDIGYLAPGMAADFFAVDLNTLAFAGGLHDVVASVLLCAPPTVNYSVINGRVVVREGQLTTVDLSQIVEQHNKYARQIVRGEI